MKPLNLKERNNLFFQFLVFYVVSIIVVLFAAFGNIQMNQKRNDELEKEKNRLNAVLRSQQEFMAIAEKQEVLFAGLDNEKDLSSAKNTYETNQSSMRTIVAKDTTWANNLHLPIFISSFDKRWEDKENLANKSSDQDELEKLQTKLANCEKENQKQYLELVKCIGQPK